MQQIRTSPTYSNVFPCTPETITADCSGDNGGQIPDGTEIRLI